ncbi:MAG: 30S ribosome-binding factor RbfA [Gemmatimonadetes bacterium]|nr:30S ribosome-binding factor RbfA [Gemmatimonadota bacterium]MBI3567447.1 30S ribosome-binding factor RbfA [Gemmatimonadota bacterium]
MARDPHRPDRVAEAVREEIAAALAGGVKDPRVTGMVTVTGVEMSRDLGSATVFVSIYGSEKEQASTLEGLQATAPKLRGPVGRALKLRLAPYITFKQDDSIARAARIESLLASIKPKPDDAPDDRG